MRRVFLCSPFAGNTALNLAYLRLALRDSLSRGEAPLAPHAIYPRALDDSDTLERETGLKAGLAWLPLSDYLVCYVDLGISPGMQAELDEAARRGITVEMRTVPGFEDWLGKEVDKK